MESQLVEKRANLERVVQMLLARQKEWDFHTQRDQLTAEGGSERGRGLGRNRRES